MRKHSLAAQTHDCNLKAILTMLLSCLVNDWIVPESTSYCLFSFSPRGAAASNDSKVIKLFAISGQPTDIGCRTDSFIILSLAVINVASALSSPLLDQKV